MASLLGSTVYSNNRPSNEEIEKIPFSTEIEKLINTIPEMLEIAFDIFTILFIFATLALALSMVFKNPQWTKWSMGTMIFTLVTVVLLRVAPIFMLTKDVMQFKLIVNYIIVLLRSVGIHVAIGMILIGLVIRFFYNMHENPSHHRWARNLFIGGGAVTILSLVMPAVFEVL
ncbi:hypothetical protein [Bacillus sp. SM2101]|uniref:hypothetical protein n=1 Tax=Bacillus sp. SM2101 TaxID=2805366 RepID=UPI001BDDF2C1|nr:hypothetical protein [Bacillus sp. SM2101]